MSRRYTPAPVLPWTAIGPFFVAFIPQFAALCLADKLMHKPLAWRYNLSVALVCGLLIQSLIHWPGFAFYFLGFCGGVAGSFHSQFRKWKKAGRPTAAPGRVAINWVTMLLSGLVAALAVHFVVKWWPQ